MNVPGVDIEIDYLPEVWPYIWFENTFIEKSNIFNKTTGQYFWCHKTKCATMMQWGFDYASTLRLKAILFWHLEIWSLRKHNLPAVNDIGFPILAQHPQTTPPPPCPEEPGCRDRTFFKDSPLRRAAHLRGSLRLPRVPNFGGPSYYWPRLDLSFPYMHIVGVQA